MFLKYRWLRSIEVFYFQFAIFVIKILAMATYNITINEKTRARKKLVALLESLNEVVAFAEVKKNKGMDEALDDIKNSRVFEAENAKDLIDNCLQ
jgi:hypothetical protein